MLGMERELDCSSLNKPENNFAFPLVVYIHVCMYVCMDTPSKTFCYVCVTISLRDHLLYHI